MEKISRRAFVKKLVINGAVLSFGDVIFHSPLKALAGGKYDIGECKSIKVKCISELPCFDNKMNIKTIMNAGGLTTNQWKIPWVPENSAGSCTLIDMEALDGTHHKFLLDVGWSISYMDQCFKREGVDTMLKKGEIEAVLISHEHIDHFWGLESVLKHNPNIKIYIPDTFYPEALKFLKGAEFPESGARNLIPHTGKLIQFKPGTVNKIYEGCAAVGFDVPVGVRCQGEQSLYFNVKGKGIVCVSGCCHQGILNMAEFAWENIAGGKNMFGIYGGLHITMFGNLTKEKEEIIKGMAKYGFEKVACNHCTGIEAVKKMVELGYPVVRGTGRFGSWTDLYVGNGDEVFFGIES